MHTQFIQLLGAVLTVAVTLFALWLGDRPVRILAVASATAFVLSPLVQNWSNFIAPQWGVAAIDAAMLGVLTVLLLRYDRRWLIAIWGTSALSVLAHVAKLIDPTLFARGYIGGLYILYFAFLGFQACGIIETVIRRRRAEPSPAEQTSA